ncbi:uncharacterized protein BDW43DRAFT_202834 [Aspergillus alliaceus]|uniref:uncharacterized protein n=1 Tax=Petromyces alliaceus TaxID=209559 RepID=UPI0012A60818|nr:uncharacterized protein BDW43DRAFT_202834 [Aspergillus alliaceus]KAB8237244.1 hypothetical protein BDW43DRAFT_202834 [Aspergillus alliaceus]
MGPNGLEPHQSLLPRSCFLAFFFSLARTSDPFLYLYSLVDFCSFFRLRFPPFSHTRVQGPLVSYQPICMFHRPTRLE